MQREQGIAQLSGAAHIPRSAYRIACCSPPALAPVAFPLRHEGTLAGSPQQPGTMGTFLPIGGARRDDVERVSAPWAL